MRRVASGVRRRPPVAPVGGAAVIGVFLAVARRGATRAGEAADLAPDEPPQEVLAVVLAVWVALVLGQHRRSMILEAPVHYGRDFSRDQALAAVNLHLVRAGVGALVDDASDRGRRPHRAGPALAALEAHPRSGNTLVVQALALAVQGRALRYIGNDLTHDPGLVLDDLQADLVRSQPVAVGYAPCVLAVPVRPVQPGSRPLGYGSALVLGEAGEHLEDEAAGWGGGVYGLRGAPQGDACGLEAVVGVHDDQERPSQPI